MFLATCICGAFLLAGLEGVVAGCDLSIGQSTSRTGQTGP